MIQALLDQVIEKMFSGSTELFNLAKSIHDKDDDTASYVSFLTRSNEYDSMLLFTNLVNLFTYPIEYADGNPERYKKAVYLFIDEVDDISQTSPANQRAVNDLLRHIYDNCSQNFCIIVALSAEVSELSYIFEEFILTRVNRRFEFQLLEPSESSHFIKEILNSARIDNDNQNDFYPFTEDAINTIVGSMTSVVPRKLVNAMHDILEVARTSEFVPSDSKLIDQAALDNLDIQEEVLENL